MKGVVRAQRRLRHMMRSSPRPRSVPLRNTDDRSSDATPRKDGYRYIVDGAGPRQFGAFMDPKWYEQLNKMIKHRELSQRAIAAFVVLSVVGGALIVRNWQSVKLEVAKESADLVKETIASPELQTTASLFSKELLQSLLTDENVKNTVSIWVMDLLTNLQTQIGALVVKILQQEQVLGQVRKLGDDLVAHLAQSAEIQKLVSHLLLQAIWLPTAQESVAKWVTSPTIMNGLKDLIIQTLDTEDVQDKITEKVRVLSDDLVAHLSHSETIQQQVSHLLLQAIWLPTAQESVAKWVTSPTILQGTQDLVNTVLVSEEVQNNASVMLSALLKELLANDATKIQLSDTIQTALSDASVLEAARDAAWSIVNPFWSHQKKMTPEEMVKYFRSLPLTESDKHALADLALETALPATLTALADADLSTNVDYSRILVTATVRHADPDDLVRELVVNNKLAILPVSSKQSLLDHLRILSPDESASSGSTRSSSSSPRECIRVLDDAVDKGDLSDAETEGVARVACRANPIQAIKRLQTCVLKLEERDALAVAALQSAPMETLEHLVVAPLHEEERQILGQAAAHIAPEETLRSFVPGDMDDAVTPPATKGFLAQAAVQAAREETLLALEESQLSDEEKRVLVDVVLRVAPDMVSRRRLQTPWPGKDGGEDSGAAESDGIGANEAPPAPTSDVQEACKREEDAALRMAHKLDVRHRMQEGEEWKRARTNREDGSITIGTNEGVYTSGGSSASTDTGSQGRSDSARTRSGTGYEGVGSDRVRSISRSRREEPEFESVPLERVVSRLNAMESEASAIQRGPARLVHARDGDAINADNVQADVDSPAEGEAKDADAHQRSKSMSNLSEQALAARAVATEFLVNADASRQRWQDEMPTLRQSLLGSYAALYTVLSKSVQPSQSKGPDLIEDGDSGESGTT